MDSYIQGEVHTEMIVKLNEIETLALKTIMKCPCEWTANAVHERARVAIDAIVEKYVQEALKNGWEIPQTKLEIVKAYNEIKLLDFINVVAPIS